MTVEPLLPDVALPCPGGASGGASAFGRLVDAAAAIFGDAERAERAFATHRGGLAEMVVERARADVALQVAAASAQRVTQGVQTVLGMQV